MFRKAALMLILVATALSVSIAGLNTVDEDIFRNRFFRGYSYLKPEYPYTVSFSFHPPRPGPTKAYEQRMMDLALAFNALLIDTNGDAFDSDLHAIYLHCNEKIISLLGSRPANLDAVMKTAFPVFRESGLLEKIVQYAEGKGSKPASEIPSDYINIPKDWGKSFPGVIGATTQPQAETCLDIFYYCPSARTITIKTFGNAGLEECKRAYEALQLSKDADAVRATLDDLATQAESIDPANTQEIKDFVRTLRKKLDEAGIGQLLDARIHRSASGVKGAQP